MGEKQAITVRLTEEAYGQVKKYAGETGESMGGAVCRIIEEFFRGASSGVPPPAPSPRQPAGAGPEIPEELLGVPERVTRLEEQGAALQGYVEGLSARVEGLSARVEEYHRMVGQLLGVVSATVPHVPTLEEWMQKFAGGRGRAPGE